MKFINLEPVIDLMTLQILYQAWFIVKIRARVKQAAVATVLYLGPFYSDLSNQHMTRGGVNL